MELPHCERQAMSDPSGAAWFPGCAPTRHSCGPRGPSVLCDAPQELAATETVSAPLFSAVKAGDTPLVSSLLARGFFIDCTDRVRVPATTSTLRLQRRARWDSHLCSPGVAFSLWSRKAGRLSTTPATAATCPSPGCC